ncbi:MAG: NAD(P)-dependent oxidoreductase [Planctomycetes bacterium]|nr:NAD(P)-dependent oxidoreductase [Planctomycetota bacterium]
MSGNRMQVAWVGIGVMGASLAGHLLRAGHAVRMHTRTRARAEPLLSAGAIWADSPAEAADGADAAFAMVGFPDEVEAVFLGERGFLGAKHAPKVVIDMGTSPPALSRRIAEAAAVRGVGALDAPVSGGDVGARNATLSIMVGGAEADFARVRPLFDVMGKIIVHQGPAGAGQLCKMVNQILVANSMVGACEAMVAARAAGLDAERVLQSVSGGAAGSWTLQNLVPRMLKGDWNPGFFASHLAKDLRIAREQTRSDGESLPGLELSERLFQGLEALGHGRLGTQALLKAWHDVLGQIR